MKILYVITSLTMGGAEKLAVDLIPRLWAKGHVVDIAVFNGKETPLMQKLRQDAPQAKIYKLGTGYYNPLYILKLMRLMRRYDLVHTHNSSPQLFASIAKVVCSHRPMDVQPLPQSNLRVAKSRGKSARIHR